MDKLTLGEFDIPVTVTDQWGNEVYGGTQLTIVDTMHPLKKGWNLVSVPVRLDDAYSRWEDIFNLGNGLQAIDALRYDTTLGQWVGLDPDYRLKPLEAIYIYASENDQMSSIFARNPTLPPMRDLATGWNLVGYPSSSNKYRDDALNNLDFGNQVDSIWTYNSGAQKWEEVGELNYFVVGKGYWIHVKENCVWEVPL